MMSTDTLVRKATIAVRRSGLMIAKARRDFHAEACRQLVRDSFAKIAAARQALEQANAAIARTDGRRL
jgi:hypothetical protein